MRRGKIKFEEKLDAIIETLKTEEDRDGHLLLAEKEGRDFHDVAKKIVARSRRRFNDPSPGKRAVGV